MTHVPEHLAQVANARGQFGVRPAAPLPPEGPLPKTKGLDPRGPEAKAKGYAPIVPGERISPRSYHLGSGHWSVRTLGAALY